jgi:hypothetical protein
LAYGSLTPSQIGELVRGFSSPHEAALEAIEDRRYKRLFDEIGGVRVVEQDGRLYAVPSSPTSETRFWDLVYAWAEDKLRDAEPKGESAALDLGGGGYTQAEIGAAVDLLKREQIGPRALQREGEMSYPRARRLSGWFTSGAAGWNDKTSMLTAAAGFRWVKRNTRAGERRWQLVRSDRP